MRPEYLEIEGLQSYKTLQKINFATLTENGLFGIFGKTGSGKSTVLDAITLALYGKVSRASRNTQGIMNNDCDKMRVLFDFSILEENTRKFYRIERVFARKTESTYDTKIARMFLRRDDGELPIAEKSGDIDKAVFELLGLEYEDFTRAVVLPQNKFQEFLGLEKSKKLSMLERLFSLGEYGAELTDKVKVKLDDLEKEYENVKGQLSQIEDADDDALKAAKEKFAKLEKEKSAEITRFAEWEKEYSEIKDLYETSVKRIKLEGELSVLLEEKDYIESIKTKLFLCEKAKEMEPLWKTYKSIAANIKDIEKQLESLAATISKLTDKILISENRVKFAGESAEKKLPALYEKRSALKGAVGLQEKSDYLKKNIEEKEELIEKLKEESLTVAAEKSNNTKRRAEIGDIISGYEAFFAENKPKLALRSLLIEGQKLESDAASAKEESEKIKTSLDELKVKKENIEKEVLQNNEKIAELSEKCEKRTASVQATVSQYQSFKADYTAEKEKLEKEIAGLRLDETAYDLSLTLEDAKPCPVCGSMHHPAPAKLNEESVARIKTCLEEIAHYEKEIADADRIIFGFTNGYSTENRAKVLDEIDDLKAEISSLRTKNEINADRLSEIDSEIARTSVALDGAIKIMHEKNNAFMKFISEHNLGNIGEELEKLDGIENEVTQTEAENIKLCRERDELTETYSTILERQGKINSELEAALCTVREQKSTLEEVEKQIAALVSEGTIYDEIDIVEKEITEINLEKENAEKELDMLKTEKINVEKNIGEFEKDKVHQTEKLEELEVSVKKILEETGINSPDSILQANLSEEMENNYKLTVADFEKDVNEKRVLIANAKEKLKGKTVTATEFEAETKQYEKRKEKRDEAVAALEVARNELEKIEQTNRKWKIVSESHRNLVSDIEAYTEIKKLLSGNKFVEYVAEESLKFVLLEASEILSSLTNGRYRIELGSEGEFVIRDYLSGGKYRAVGTLSGGETFLTSLSLAIALSKQIQLKGRSPLEFFFLDEGFGSLDGELLDTVMNALETIASGDRIIGIVSHLKELQERISRRLVVCRDGENSSKVKTEIA